MGTETGFTFVPDQSIGDLSQFNFSLFDPTSALHWVQFAQHWHNTYQVGLTVSASFHENAHIDLSVRP